LGTSHGKYDDRCPISQIEKARVFRNGRSQAVRIPAEYRFRSDEVYIRHNGATRELTPSERPVKPSLDEIFAELDAAGAADFVIERDLSISPERKLL
jgi:antitoxin VapB